MHIPTKFPTLIGLLLLVVGVGGSIVFVESATRGSTAASGSTKPDNVQTTNLSDTSFTVTWTTQLPTTGVIILATPKQTAVDDRDSDGKLQKYTTHSVTVRRLQPTTNYTFTILSNHQQYRKNDAPYQVMTGPALEGTAGNIEPAYGTIRQGNNQPAEGALVYLTLEGGQTLSTVTKPTGSWLIPLNITRVPDTSRYVTAADRMTETILVRSGPEEATAITDTLNDAPVPDMTLGKTYDFRGQQAKNGKAPLAAKSNGADKPAVLGAQTETAAPNTSSAVSLIAPAQGAALPTAFPLIQGTGIAGKMVSITLGITDPFGGITQVGSDGLWRYSPTKALAAGRQSVTMTSVDSTGKAVAVTHTFTILKGGTQVLGDATPSATLTPEPTIVPTVTVTPTPEASIAAKPIPTSGSTLPTIILLIMAAGLVATGGVTLLLH